jgi:glycosyltransferase involved in cell wall biosynthesis
MKPIRILVDSFADAGLLNAQMGNAREIVSRLDAQHFHVTMFTLGVADPRIIARANTRLVQLPQRRQTVRIISEFFWGKHSLLFYMKASPASRWYQTARKKWKDVRTTIGTIESQSDLRNEATITSASVRLWEQTVLQCDYLYSNSRCVQSSLQHEYGLPSEVIPTGVDTQFFSPAWQRPVNNRTVVLFVGSLRPFKQPQLLLTAAARFPEADFHIAGDGPMAAELAARVERENLRNVSLLGRCHAEELRTEYRRADVFLFPSAWEGSPKVILEAAACGLPVIARNSYAPESVLHGITGYQAASDEELFHCLEALIANSDLRKKLGQAGRAHSLNFDWGKIAHRWEQTFVDLAKRRSLRQAS